VEGELLDAAAVRALEPALDGPLHGASRFPADLPVDPVRVAQALVREAQDAGARLRTGCRVERIRVERGRATGLETAGGPIAAGAVVLAAGPWSGALAAGAGLPLPLEPRKGQLVRLRPPSPDWVRHKVVDASYLASVESADAGLQLATVVETTWGGDLLVGSSRERRGFDHAIDVAVGDASGSARPPGCARGCPTTGPRSGPPSASSGCGWRPGTRAPAWRSGRSRAGSSPRRTAASRSW
jgi:glycine/D-amino acid oxidase-like deaminating enzyme